MPHTVNWTAADWSYAADSLEVAVRASREDAGVSWWSELRHRQQEMGVTWSSRQSARIRYIPPAVDDDSDASISTLDDYRNL